jgi:hypothetical protein
VRALHGLVDATLGLSEAQPTPDPSGSATGSPAFVLTPPSPDLAGALPASPGPLPWRELAPLAAWEAFLQRVRAEDELLFAVLGELGLSRLAGGVLELCAARRSFARDQLEERPDLRARLSTLLEEQLGDAFEVVLLDEPPSLPGRPSLALLEAQRRAQRHAEVEERARSDPRIRALLSTFDGRLRAVRPREARQDDPR